MAGYKNIWMVGWIGKKYEKNGCMVVWIPHTQLFIIYNIPIHYT